jgi:hypothetical protein
MAILSVRQIIHVGKETKNMAKQQQELSGNMQGRGKGHFFYSGQGHRQRPMACTVLAVSLSFHYTTIQE